MPLEVEARVRRFDGAYRWCLARAVPVPGDEAGRVDGWIGTVTDVTEQRLGRARLDTVLEAMGDAYYSLDREWRFTHVNSRAEAILQRSAEELLGRNVWGEFPEAAGGIFEQQYRLALTSGQLIEFETYFAPLDLWVEVRAIASEDGLSVFFRDIGQRHREESSRREVLARLTSLLENAPVGMGIVDRETRYVQVNEALARLNGVPLREHTGRKVREVLPEIGEIAEGWIARVIATGEPVLNVEVAGGKPANTARPAAWLVSYFPVRSQDGEVFGVGIIVDDHTARQEAERRLRESEARYRALVRATAQIVWRTDAQGMNEDMPEWCAYTGQTADEAAGWGWLDALHPDDRGRAREAWEEAVRSTSAYAVEYRVRGSDGRYRPFEARGVPVLNDDGSVHEWVGTCNDVSARVEAEEAEMREHEERERATALLEALLANAPVGFAFLDHDLRFQKLNATLAEINGLPVEAHVGRSVQEIVPDLAPAAEGYFRDVLASGQPRLDVHIRGETAKLPGVTRHWLENYYPVALATGETIGVGAVVMEVTAQKTAEERTRRLQQVTVALAEAYQTSEVVAALGEVIAPAIDASALAVALLDPAGEALRMIGAYRYDDDWMHSWHTLELSRRIALTDAVRESRPVFMPDLVTAESLYPGSFAPGVANGRKAWAALPLVVQGKAIGGLAISFADEQAFDEGQREFLATVARQCAVALDRARLYESERAARERLEERVKERTRELEERNAEQETFIYTASHDLRQPLLSIQGMSSLLGDAVAEDDHEQARWLVERINANTSKMSDLLNDLLALSRVGRTEAESAPVNLAEVAREVANELEGRSRRRGVNIEWPDEWPVIRYPRGEAYQLLANLVGNAVKFAGRPGSTPLVRITWRDAGDDISLRVEDNGPGVQPEHRERIFRLFAKLSNDGEGTGVGLAIVKRIAERHGGQVTIGDSDLGGAAFEVTLPKERRRPGSAYVGPERRT